MPSVILTHLLSYLFFQSFTALTVKSQAGVCGDYVYTIGDDEFCTLYIGGDDNYTFTENCTTFDPKYNISQTNGLAMNPSTGDIYIVASINEKSGPRALMSLDINTFELTTIATYTSGSQKLSAIAYTCDTDTHSASLYGVTGAQSDHSLYKINVDDGGSFTQIGSLDSSNVGNGLAYNPYDDKLYRVGGNNQIDIEAIDYTTINVNVTIESNDYIDNINKVSAIGYSGNQYLYLISGEEILYLINVNDGNDIINITMLNTNRQHKGIVCANMIDICDYYYTDYQSTDYNYESSTDMPNNDDDGGNDDDASYKLFISLTYVIIFVVMQMFVVFN